MEATPWEVALVARLSRLLCGGPRHDERFFNAAFDKAIKDCPPRGRDTQRRLFDEDGRREVGLVDAMREYCRQAWMGENPSLARFNAELLVSLDLIGQESEPDEAIAA